MGVQSKRSVTKKRNIGKLAQIPVIVSAETKIPTGTKVYGMEVVGMKRNLKTWKKERAVYSLNNALSPCNVDPYAIISGSKTCKDLANKRNIGILAQIPVILSAETKSVLY